MKERLEMRGRHRLVVVPPHLLVACAVADDELVGGRSARVLTGERDERAAPGDMAFAPDDRALIKLRRGQIPIYGLQIAEALLLEPVGAGCRVSCDISLHSPTT